MTPFSSTMDKCVLVEVEEAEHMAEARILVSEAVFDGSKVYWSYLCSGLFSLRHLLICVEWKKRRPITPPQLSVYFLHIKLKFTLGIKDMFSKQ